jgi:hypothetical protein
MWAKSVGGFLPSRTHYLGRRSSWNMRNKAQGSPHLKIRPCLHWEAAGTFMALIIDSELKSFIPQNRPHMTVGSQHSTAADYSDWKSAA